MKWNLRLRARDDDMGRHVNEIVEDLPGAGVGTEEAGGSVKTAIVMARLGLRREEAERRLACAGGRVSQALKWTNS